MYSPDLAQPSTVTLLPTDSVSSHASSTLSAHFASTALSAHSEASGVGEGEGGEPTAALPPEAELTAGAQRHTAALLSALGPPPTMEGMESSCKQLAQVAMKAGGKEALMGAGTIPVLVLALNAHAGAPGLVRKALFVLCLVSSNNWG